MTETLDTGRSPSAPRHRQGLLVFFLLLMVLLHLRAFAVPHEEGDERAYLALAQEMGWDLSDYTTRDHPTVSRYPYSIYRQSLFHHPPLYPLVLKLGIAVGAPVFVGLGFQVLAMALLLVFAQRAARRMELPESLQAALLAGLVLGPLLFFSTTRLHHDGLLAIFLFCAFTLYVEALETRSTGKAVGAGLLFAAALNVRYNALVALPLIGAVQLFHLYRQAAATSGGDGSRASPLLRVARDPTRWKGFGVVALLVLALGLPHYVRVLATYGTLLPSSFIVPDAGVESWNDFLRRVHARSRLHVALYLLAIFPMALTWVGPSALRQLAERWRERSWELVYPCVALFLLSVQMLTVHTQVRYFAAMSPFLITSFALQIHGARGGERRALWMWAASTLLLMSISSFVAIFQPGSAEVFPALFFLLPFLQPHYL